MQLHPKFCTSLVQLSRCTAIIREYKDNSIIMTKKSGLSVVSDKSKEVLIQRDQIMKMSGIWLVVDKLDTLFSFSHGRRPRIQPKKQKCRCLSCFTVRSLIVLQIKYFQLNIIQQL